MHRHHILRYALVALLAGTSVAGCTGIENGKISRPDKAETWYQRAKKEFTEGDFEDAHDSVSKALAIVKEDPEVRILAGEIAISSLDYAEVLQLLKGVPGTEAARLRGRALWYKGDLEAAADELEAMLNDPEVKDEWAKATSKLARRSAGRTPFKLPEKTLVGAVEMVHVSPVAPYFVVPVEIDGESALAMITTGSAEVVLDSATRQEPSWISLRFDHFEVQDVPALAQDLSGISKELGAPIKAMLGVNLLRHLNATFDFTGRQFVVRSFPPPPPPAATRLDLHYARGGGMVVRASLGGEKGPRAAMLVDTSKPFFVALDPEGFKKAGIDMATLKPIAGDPEQKLKEGILPLMRLGAFDIPRVSALSGVNFTDLEKATAVDLDGLIGAGVLYPYRCTFADGGRVLWIEDDTAVQKMMNPGTAAPPPENGPEAPPLLPAGGLPGQGGLLSPPLGGLPAGPINESDKLPAPPAPAPKKKK